MDYSCMQLSVTSCLSVYTYLPVYLPVCMPVCLSSVGDIILTGTPDGVGSAMSPPQFLKHGDVVDIEIEHIGRLRNAVL